MRRNEREISTDDHMFLYYFISSFAVVDDCSSHPCQNGGSCCDKGDHYECSCPVGYQGQYCEISK